MSKQNLSIVFFGTPEFAVAQLDAIYKAGYKIAAVVTAVDKPSGRGKKLVPSAVKQYALTHGLSLMQPPNLKEPSFIERLAAIQADIFVVVAFRMLPKQVWTMPPLGTFNLHASMLPQYRGAAPINHAIMNGETETGLTTFYINEAIDEGHIILQKNLAIHPEDNAGSLHDRMMHEGALLVLSTLEHIQIGEISAAEQGKLLLNTPLKPAPKLFRDDCRIDWKLPLPTIHNKIRGLSPYPGAFATFKGPNGEVYEVKILKGSFEVSKAGQLPFVVQSDNRRIIKVGHADGFFFIERLKFPGKKELDTAAFLNGFDFNGQWIVL